MRIFSRSGIAAGAWLVALLVAFCVFGRLAATSVADLTGTLHANDAVHRVVLALDSADMAASDRSGPDDDDSDDGDDEDEDDAEEAEEEEEAIDSDEHETEDAEGESEQNDDEAATDEETPRAVSKDRTKTPGRGKSKSGKAAKDKDASSEETKSNTPQVEVYVPSVTGLVDAYRRSRTAKVVDSFLGLIPSFEQESDEDFDFSAVIEILRRLADWPDTSLVLTTYPQDREGRARWAIRVDWPLADCVSRVEEMISGEKARKVLGEVSLRRQDDGSFRLELPDLELAVFRADGNGCLVVSNAELVPPKRVFGQKDASSGDKTASSSSYLIYCRLNMEAGKEDEEEQARGGLLGSLSVVSDLRYAGKLGPDGAWSERINLRWNPMLGLFIKSALKKVKQKFECPREAFAAGVLHLAMGEGMADMISGLPTGTMGARVEGEMAFSVLPGEGFFPIPDVYYQFPARRIDRIHEDIRAAIKKDNSERKDDDRPPAWFEEDVDGRTIFFHDSAADRHGGLSFSTSRTVIFFEEPSDGEENKGPARLIVVSTSGWPDDAVKRWEAFRKSPASRRRVMPAGSNTHWQLNVNWKTIYELVRPYLSLMLAGTSSAERPMPSAEDIAANLSDSELNVKIEYAGVDVRHDGPLPIGAVYVPLITGASLTATSGGSSEAERERMACRNLRVLYHHAKLFRKDYGRWPATVAELDGYVDFASHPHLLDLPAKGEGFLTGFVSMFTQDRKAQARDELDEGEIDETLYEIDWDEDAWQLRFRSGEFVKWATIYVDQEGEIHRVEMSDGTADGESGGASDKKKRGKGDEDKSKKLTLR